MFLKWENYRVFRFYDSSGQLSVAGYRYFGHFVGRKTSGDPIAASFCRRIPE